MHYYDVEMAALTLGQAQELEKGAFEHAAKVVECAAKGGTWVGGEEGFCQFPTTPITKPAKDDTTRDIMLVAGVAALLGAAYFLWRR